MKRTLLSMVSYFLPMASIFNSQLPQDVKSNPSAVASHDDEIFLNSPAYRYYQELLRNGDTVLKQSVYACFYDDPKSTDFAGLFVTLLGSKQDMMAIISEYESGVLSENVVFQGPVSPLSNVIGFSATIPRTENDLDKVIRKSYPEYQQQDTFEWAAGNVAFRIGFHTGIKDAHTTQEFKMQRSTGRYIEETLFTSSISTLPSKLPVRRTGRCIRVPNVPSPEELWLSK